MIQMRRYIPVLATMVVGAIAFAVVAADWGPYGQLGASAVVVVVVNLVMIWSGLYDAPPSRNSRAR